MKVPEFVGVPEIVIVSVDGLNVADTPMGKPLEAAIPVTLEVECEISDNGRLKQSVGNEGLVPELILLVGLIVIVLLADVNPQTPPKVEIVSVNKPISPEAGIYVAPAGSLGFIQVPAPPDQVPPIALPPTEPAITSVAVSSQTIKFAVPASTIGFALTVTVVLD